MGLPRPPRIPGPLGGRSLKAASEANRLGLGLRNVLARHVIFHWNRMGFSTRQQAIWSRAAREALVGRDLRTPGGATAGPQRLPE
ncbi:hypothetical protein OG713_45440 (plasmid) [Streptomyces sp. NBC_00723]